MIDGLLQEFEDCLFGEAPGLVRVVDSPAPAVPHQPFPESVAIPQILAIHRNEALRVAVVVVETRKKIWTAGRRACFKSLDEGVDIGLVAGFVGHAVAASPFSTNSISSSSP